MLPHGGRGILRKSSGGGCKATTTKVERRENGRDRCLIGFEDLAVNESQTWAFHNSVDIVVYAGINSLQLLHQFWDVGRL
jgi:hypothetical protein